MGRDPPNPREHDRFFGDYDLEDIHDQLTTIEVDEVKYPQEAENERGNHEVDVIVHQFEKVFVRYRFKFNRPRKNAEYPYFRQGPYRYTRGCELTKHYNEALQKAANGLMEETNTAVQIRLEPMDELAELEGRYVEEE